MFRTSLLAIVLICLYAAAQTQPNSDVKFVADTLIVQADGSYETDPDLATLTFDVSSQEKQLKDAYGKASQSMSNIVAVAQRNGLTKDAGCPRSMQLTFLRAKHLLAALEPASMRRLDRFGIQGRT